MYREAFGKVAGYTVHLWVLLRRDETNFVWRRENSVTATSGLKGLEMVDVEGLCVPHKGRGTNVAGRTTVGCARLAS